MRLCGVCGKPTSFCNRQEPLGGGLTVTRLDRSKELNIMKVTVSKEKVYLNKDKTAVVPADSPDAAWLLVGKGGAIEEAVARHYGIETEETEAVSKVETNIDDERRAMVTDGSSKATAANYQRMFAQREAERDLKAEIGTPNPAIAGGGQQAAMLIAGKVAEQFAETDNSAPVGGDYPAAPRSDSNAEFSGGFANQEEADKASAKVAGVSQPSTSGSNVRTNVIGDPANSQEASLKDALNEKDLQESKDNPTPPDTRTPQEKANDLTKELNANVGDPNDLTSRTLDELKDK